MPEIPSSPKPQVATYVWAVVIMVLIACGLVMGILMVRPAADPASVVGLVLVGLGPTMAGVLAFLKSQETHLSVNSRLDAFMLEHGKSQKAEGKAEGILEEQARVISLPAAPIVIQQVVPAAKSSELPGK